MIILAVDISKFPYIILRMMETILALVVPFVVGMLGTYTLLDFAYKIQKREVNSIIRKKVSSR
ncbi:MAG: putative membrane protein [Candidatus Nitrosomirales archaeon]|jgi:uncharacterized membrane protein